MYHFPFSIIHCITSIIHYPLHIIHYELSIILHISSIKNIIYICQSNASQILPFLKKCHYIILVNLRLCLIGRPALFDDPTTSLPLPRGPPIMGPSLHPTLPLQISSRQPPLTTQAGVTARLTGRICTLTSL